MKRFRALALALVLTMLIGAVSGCGGSSSSAPSSSAPSSSPSSGSGETNEEFVKLSEQPVLYFFGDEEWAVSNYDLSFCGGFLGDNAVGYFAYCFEVLFADRDPKFSNFAQNNGTMATLSNAIGSRFNENASTKPDIAFIQLGDNDLAAADMTPEKYTADLKAILDKVTANGTRAVVVGPVTAKEEGDAIREKLPTYIDAAKAACAGNAFVKHIDFQATADATADEYVPLSKETHEKMTILADEVQVKLSSAMVRELDLVKVSGRQINPEAFAGGTKTVIIEGDSISDCYRSNHKMGDRMSEDMDLGYGHAMGVKAYLDAVYGDVIVMNGAISGSTTTSILARQENNVTSWEPDYLIMMIGINDIGLWLPAEQREDIDTILSGVQSNLTAYFDGCADIDRVLYISPFYGAPAEENIRKNFAEPIAAKALEVAANYSNITTLKSQPFISEAGDKHGMVNISYDSVHMAAKGYRVFLAQAMNALGW